MPAADPLTALISSMSYEPLTQLSAFFHSTQAMAASFALLLALTYFVLKDKRKLVLIIATVALSIAVSESAKAYVQVPRPCAPPLSLPSKVPCPDDSAFPSGHSIAALALAAAVVGESLFLPYFLFALFIMFSRLYLGVHQFIDVAGSLALASAAYAFAAAAYNFFADGKMREKAVTPHSESGRQLLHIGLGLLVPISLLIFGRIGTAYLLSSAVIAGAALIHIKLRGAKLPFIDSMLHRFERPGETPGYGTLWYAVGFLLIVTLLKDPAQIMASSLILAIADGFSTLAGLRGKTRLPYNRKKTLEGSAAFFLSSALLAFPLIGIFALPLALLTAIAESISLGIDDNVTVPLVCVVFLRLAG